MRLAIICTDQKTTTATRALDWGNFAEIGINML